MTDYKTKIILTADDKTRQAFDAVEKRFSSLSNLATDLLPALSFAGLAAFVKSSIDAADHLNDLSKITRISVEDLAGLGFAAETAGGDLDGIAASINKLGVNIGKDSEKFKKLGVDATDPIEAFKQLADISNKIQDPFKRDAVLAEALGKSWQSAASLMSEGSEEIKRLIDKGTVLSGITKENTEQADKFNAQMVELKKQAGAVGVALGSMLIPKLTDTIRYMHDATVASEGFWGAFLAVGTSEDQIGPKLTETAARLKELKQLRADLDPNKSTTNKINDFVFGDAGDLDKQIAVAQQELKTLQKLEDLRRSRIKLPSLPEENSTGSQLNVSDFLDPSKANKVASDAKRLAEQNLAIFKEGREALAKTILEFQAASETGNVEPSGKLQKQLDAYRALDPELQKYLQSLVDITKQNEQSALANQALLDSIDINQNQTQQEASDAAARFDAFKNLRDAMLAENEDLNIGLIMSDKNRAKAQLHLEHERAIARIEQLGLEADEVQELTDEETANYELRLKQLDGTKNAAKELGLTFTSAFEDAATSGKDLSEVLQSLLVDVEKFFLRKGVTDPLLNALDGFDFGSLFGGAAPLPDFVPSFAVGTDYVPRDMLAQIHKGERIVPAAENAGYGGGSTNINISVDASGSSAQGDSHKASELGRVIGAAVQSELIKQKRPGGILA